LLSVVRVVSNIVVKNTDRKTNQDVGDETQLSEHLITHDTEEGSLQKNPELGQRRSVEGKIFIVIFVFLAFESCFFNFLF